MTPSEVVLAFFADFWRGDLEASLSHCSHDAQFEFAPSLPYPSPAPMRQALQAILNDMYTKFDPATGMQVSVDRIMTNNNDVAIEYTASGNLQNGQRYVNRYLTLAIVHGDKLVLLRPYTDTAYVSESLLKRAVSQ